MTVGCSYFGSRFLRHVAADMEDLAARGFDGVLHTFSENDLAYYRDTIRRIVAASHTAGLEVQIAPWGVCQMFGGEAESRFTAQHPELGQVLETGRSTPSGCPNNPRVRTFLHAWADAAIDTGADRIFWDEPHWVHPEHFELDPSHWGCRCQVCRDLFREWHGSDLPTELTREVLAFREDSMVAFLGDLVDHVARQGARPTVCLLPLTGGAQGISDWSRVAALPGLDTLATDPYWKAFDESAESFVGEYARRVRDLGDRYGVGAQLWIQGFRLEPEDEGDVRAAADIARSAGISDLWTWGYEACGHMSHLAGSDPVRMWAVLCEALTAEAPPPAPAEVHDPALADLDLRSTLDIVRAVNRPNQVALRAVEGIEAKLAAMVDTIAERVAAGGRVIYVGAGSAGRIAALDAYEWGPTFDVPAGTVVALVAGHDLPPDADQQAEDDAVAGAAELEELEPGPLDTVVGISASGRTAYVLGAVRAAREAGALTVGITSERNSELVALVDEPLEIPVGPEVITGSSRLKAGTAQKLVLNAFSTALMVRLGRTYGNLMTSVRVTNEKLRARAELLAQLATGRPREDVAAALDAAGDHVGVAIMMLARGVDEQEARARLSAAGGVVRAALGETG